MGQVNTENYYVILGVEMDATEDAIKSSYRKLVLRYHPDRTTAPNAEMVFARIQKAYEVLSHPALREEYNRQLALNQDVADNYFHVPTRYRSQLIHMHISATMVQAGEPFTIIFYCPRRVESFKLRGLEHFELLKSVQHEMPYKGEIMTQVHYVLKALEEGSFHIGPASAFAGNMEYTSGDATIIAQGQYAGKGWAQRPWFQKYYPVGLILATILVPGIIMYNISVYGIRQPGSDERLYPFGDPTANRLETGAPPYPMVYATGGSMASGQVSITNHTSKDAVLVLLQNNDIVYRTHYVRAGDSFTFDHITPGNYHWVLLTGKSWEPGAQAPIVGYTGNFKNGTTIGSDIAGVAAFTFTEKEVDNTIFYTIYKLELSGKTGKEALGITTDTGFYIAD